MTELPGPATAAGRAGLDAMISAPQGAVLAVDFDGTLAPIVRLPSDARPQQGALDALGRLSGRLRLVAVVSGRAAADVAGLGGFGAVPGLVVAGNYGLELLMAGQLEAAPPAPGLDEARSALRELLTAAPAGVHLEDKGLSLVVHTRPAVDPLTALTSLDEGVRRIAAKTGLEVLPGRMVLELRPAGMDKGGALLRLIGAELPSAVCVIGDDVGDLPAFAAVARLRDRGVPGLNVAATADGESPRELGEQADLVLAGPPAVVEFLTALAERVGA